MSVCQTLTLWLKQRGKKNTIDVFHTSRPKLGGLPTSLSTPGQRLPPGLGVADQSPLCVCLGGGELAARQMLMAGAPLFCTHTHWILISNYNARGPIYTHLLRRGAAMERDTSSSTNQLQASPCKLEGRGGWKEV